MIEFNVTGVPVTQGSMRRARSGRMYHADAKLLPWRATIAAAAGNAWAAADPAFRVACFDPDTALSVAATFRLPRPKSVRRRWPTRRHDVDKLTRALLDALTDAGVWGDDGQVCGIFVRKRYVYAGEEPGVLVQVEVVP